MKLEMEEMANKYESDSKDLIEKYEHRISKLEEKFKNEKQILLGDNMSLMEKIKNELEIKVYKDSNVVD